MDRIAATAAEADFLLSIIDSRREDAAAGRALPVPCMRPHIKASAAALKVAQAHGVLPLFVFRFPEWHTLFDSQVTRFVREHYLTNTCRNLALAAELLSILQEFSRAEIPALPFKGVVLAAALYGNLQLRPAGDLDILIHHDDLQGATEILKSRGYVLSVQADSGETQFRHSGPAGIVVELRWRVAPRHFRRDIGMDVLWPGRRSTNLQGTPVPDLAPEEKLILLCMHGTKHEWLRLFWVCDVAQLLKIHPDLDWERAERMAKHYGLFRCLVTGVLLTRSMAGAPVPVPVLRRFERNHPARRLAEHVQKHFFDSVSPPFDGLPMQIEALGFRDRWVRLGQAAFEQPGSRDRASLHLPSTLDPLYYLVRPVRLIWKYMIRKMLS